MVEKIKNILADRYFKSSAIFFVGSLLIAVINYLYYPVLSRMLSIENFGEAQTIATIILQSTIILNAFGYVAIHLFTNIEYKEKAAKKVKNLEGSALIITSLAILTALLFQGPINGYLKFASAAPLLVISLIFLLNVLFTIKNSWLQAKHKFFDVSVGGAIAATAKLVFAVAFIWLGYEILGVLAGLLIATILSLLYVSLRSDTGIRFRSHLFTNYFREVAHDPELRRDLIFGFIIFVTLVSVTLLYSADVIFVRRYFSEVTSGFYAGIASIARIIFFATFAFSAVLLPSIKIDAASENRKNLFKALGVTALVGGIGLLTFWLFPNLVVAILIGKKYLPYAPLLPWVGLFILLASLTNVIMVYYIALRKNIVALIGAFSVALLIIAVNLYHQNIETVINDFIIVNFVALTICAGYLIYENYLKTSNISQKSS